MSSAHQISPYTYEAEPGVYQLEVLVLPDDGAAMIETTGVEVVDPAPRSARSTGRRDWGANDNAARGDRAWPRDVNVAAAGACIPFTATLPRVK
jgi:hypothetical protein